MVVIPESRLTPENKANRKASKWPVVAAAAVVVVGEKGYENVVLDALLATFLNEEGTDKPLRTKMESTSCHKGG